MAQTTEVKVRLSFDDRDLIIAVADAHRDLKRLRSHARYTDRSLARLEEVIYKSLGVSYEEVPG